MSVQKAARIPPQSLEAEQAVLGAMLLERKAIARARDLLEGLEFYREAHRIIFEAAVDLYDHNEPVDLTTLGAELENRGQLEQAGGRPYLAALLDAVPTAAHIEFYARIVQQKAALCRLVTLGTELIEESFGEVDDPAELASRFALGIQQVVRKPAGDTLFRVADGLSEAMERYEQLAANPETMAGVPTGFSGIDDETGGLQRGDVNILAGRTGMGKSALAMSIFNNAITAGYKGAYFAAEMTRPQIQDRQMQSVSGVGSYYLKTGKLTQDHWHSMVDGANTFSGVNGYIDARRGITPAYVRDRCRELAGEHGLDLVVIDYVQIMRWPGKVDNETHRLSLISDALVDLAGELNVALVVLSQLSRGVESRENKRPVVSDLRQCGKLEEDAAWTGLIYRPSYYTASNADHEEDEDEEPTELIIGKNRHGKAASVFMRFEPSHMRFVECEE